MSASAARARRTEAELMAAVRAAVIEEHAEIGLGRLTMEGIARRAGTAKTSLYRRWATPQEVLLHAVEHEFPQEQVSPTSDDLRGDLIRALRLMTEWMATPTARAAAAIVTERERYPELAKAVYTDVFAAKGGTFTRTVLNHYAEQGYFAPEALTPVVADIGEALVLKYSIDSAELPGEETLAAIVDQAILPAIGVDLPDSRAPAESDL